MKWHFDGDFLQRILAITIVMVGLSLFSPVAESQVRLNQAPAASKPLSSQPPVKTEIRTLSQTNTQPRDVLIYSPDRITEMPEIDWRTPKAQAMFSVPIIVLENDNRNAAPSAQPLNLPNK